jgi:hypothetical protein
MWCIASRPPRSSIRAAGASPHEDVVLGEDRRLVGVEVERAVVDAAARAAAASFVVVRHCRRRLERVCTGEEVECARADEEVEWCENRRVSAFKGERQSGRRAYSISTAEAMALPRG